MTTPIVVTAKKWPIRVTVIDDHGTNYAQESATVQPNTQKEFYLTYNRRLHFKELPVPRVEPLEAA